MIQTGLLTPGSIHFRAFPSTKQTVTFDHLEKLRTFKVPFMRKQSPVTAAGPSRN